MKRILLTLLCLLLSAPALAVTEIKIAVLAPEGSTWVKVLHEWNDALKTQTNNEVGFKIYSGGVVGDEKDVIRKMRIGQIHAAGFTGMGLGTINPSVRIMELPFLFNDDKEADLITESLSPTFKKGFEDKGFVHLGWAEAGFVYLMSNQPIKNINDLKNTKLWVWEGDPLAQELCRVFEIAPVPLTLPDVLTSLQTGLIDTVYAPPLGAIALQWFTKTKYISSVNITHSTGAMLISKKIWKTLSPKNQKILKETGDTYSRKLIELTRKDNQRSLQSLAKHGTKTIEISEKDLVEIKSKANAVWTNLSGKLYSAALLEKTKKILTEHRSK
ncbi:TRAP transporter substrate-binding protein DctP [bacterium]|nr:TRAP transporter substrate-binding protein DctP [bacterium]